MPISGGRQNEQMMVWSTLILAEESSSSALLGQGKESRAARGPSFSSKKNDRAVYIYGFEKKDAANIDRREVEAFRELAKVILGYTDIEIEQRVNDGALFSVVEPGGDNAQEISK